ncbi:MAG: hypothetical protein CFH38_01641 [Alphaproteobacteria bacterium MarineAlpha10_Bin1]|nr:MAG: hypothetical protein CFH38_01641 [Alphaproteobacteria bacterium MarineAlpha10_Bin1]
MSGISKEHILQAAREITGAKPTPERAEELAGTLNVLFTALDKVASDVTFEAEPANMHTALDQLAGD